jgi:ADP-ribose pyrophosphatase YjhB (NUDIX family)
VGFLDEWKYCPRCRSEVTRDDERASCPACGFVAYANSVPGAEAVCFDADGRVLLGRRRLPPSQGLWDLPGGFLHEGEHPEDALRREVEEETGRVPEPVEFLGMWNEPYDGRVVLCLTWLARLDEDVQAGDDLAELRWFSRDEIPWDELAFTHYAPALLFAFQRQQHV